MRSPIRRLEQAFKEAIYILDEELNNSVSDSDVDADEVDSMTLLFGEIRGFLEGRRLLRDQDQARTQERNALTRGRQRNSRPRRTQRSSSLPLPEPPSPKVYHFH